MPIETAKGTHATILFEAQKCVHSRGCVLSHPDVFVPNVKGEWLHPDAQPVEELMHVAKGCPSGAIRVIRHAEGEGIPNSDSAPLVNTARIRESGPLAIEAELQIRGETQACPRATLCRCGQSKNKPYCDSSHVAVGFVASGEPVTVTFADLETRNGPVNVQPIPNGPLHVSGNLEVVSGTGRTVNKVTDTYLCRCGHSKNKPYCDGSHNAVQFVAS